MSAPHIPKRLPRGSNKNLTPAQRRFEQQAYRIKVRGYEMWEYQAENDPDPYTYTEEQEDNMAFFSRHALRRRLKSPLLLRKWRREKTWQKDPLKAWKESFE